ncbi:hypothetical protein [Psychrobacter frigidicola]|uniref:hypothetical protein n=1 Tax=Psychrobacter frigidicola TaxID=45611 RepID=UPI001917C0E2|nr:hypothetical protein [Psychrobacter frigidicola]
MDVFGRIKALFSSRVEDDDVKNESDNPIRINANILKRSAIFCQCGSLQIPIEKEGNIYECIKCHKRSTRNNYNLGQRHYDPNHLKILPRDSSLVINMDYYDDAVRLLKKESNS